jgi:hypothetical protein
MNIVTLLSKTGTLVSFSQGRRAVLQNGVKVNGQSITSLEEDVNVKAGDVVTIGKRIKVVITEKMLESSP